MMRNYAQIIDGTVTNIAVFEGAPSTSFIAATGGEWMPVPEGLPVTTGCLWDGSNFLSPSGERELLPTPGPEPEPQPYDELEDLRHANNILMGVEE